MTADIFHPRSGARTFSVNGLMAAAIGSRIYPQGIFFGAKVILRWRGQRYFVFHVPHNRQYWSGHAHDIPADVQIAEVVRIDGHLCESQTTGDSRMTGRQSRLIIAEAIAAARDLDEGVARQTVSAMYPEFHLWHPPASPPPPKSGDTEENQEPPRLIGALSAGEKATIYLKHQKADKCRDRSPGFWFLMLLEEVAELGLSLLGLHRHRPEIELRQIASIAMNFEDRLGRHP